MRFVDIATGRNVVAVVKQVAELSGRVWADLAGRLDGSGRIRATQPRRTRANTVEQTTNTTAISIQQAALSIL